MFENIYLNMCLCAVSGTYSILSEGVPTVKIYLYNCETAVFGTYSCD